MARIKVHNILCSGDQVLLTLRAEGRRAEFLPSILYAFREEEVPIPFILHSLDRGGNLVLTLVLRRQDLDWAQAAFREGLDFPSGGPLEIRERVALITLYGPHLGERPGVAASMLSSLAKDGIEILALSASINSFLLAVPEDASARSLLSLERVFEIPKE